MNSVWTENYQRPLLTVCFYPTLLRELDFSPFTLETETLNVELLILKSSN